MRILFLAVLLSIATIRAGFAEEISQLAKIYTAMEQAYVKKVDIGQFATLTLKSLHTLDKRLQVADDGKRLSLYANGRVVKVVYKPEDTNDIKAWEEVSNEIIKAAAKYSEDLERRDFETLDRLMADALPKFDSASSYYSTFASSKKDEKKYYNPYAERLIDNVLYIKIGAFNKYSKENVLRTLGENKNFSGLILDLRGNQGGLLSEAVAISGLFLDEGSIVTYTIGRAEDMNKYYVAEGGDILAEKPIIILVDGQTASSAEVMAAALHEQGRATVVGTQTYGKGSVQKMVLLENDSTMALTAAYFYTPMERKIDKIGVLPDVCMSGRRENDVPERIISQEETACPQEERADFDIDIEVAQALLNKNK